MSALAIPNPGSGFKNDKTYDRVLRNSALSSPKGWEQAWRRPLTPDQERFLLKAAEIYNDRNKVQGQHNGALGFRGVQLLAYMIRQLRREGGYLRTMAIRGYATALRCSVQTIVNAIKALEAAGFLRRQRRKVELDERGPTGRRKAIQDTNIYQLDVPEKAKALHAFWTGLRRPKESQADMAARLRAEASHEALRAIQAGKPPGPSPQLPHLGAIARLGALITPDSTK
ncbi:MAG: hypothetical protein EON96_20945 [Caulobacteraceae bacterium]|nr:MAG: hypothetical protein EON96_20945 [Caulobacteraceae bacterium]